MGDALLWAVKNGDLVAVKDLAQKKDFDVNKELLAGRMAIHYAADYGHADVVEYLISKGADVNLPDKHGISPLLCAVYEDHVDVVRLLVNKGASKAGKAPDGTSYVECTENDEIKALLK
jgi:ankyrin repeat protein